MTRPTLLGTAGAVAVGAAGPGVADGEPEGVRRLASAVVATPVAAIGFSVGVAVGALGAGVGAADGAATGVAVAGAVGTGVADGRAGAPAVAVARLVAATVGAAGAAAAGVAVPKAAAEETDRDGDPTHAAASKVTPAQMPTLAMRPAARPKRASPASRPLATVDRRMHASLPPRRRLALFENDVVPHHVVFSKQPYRGATKRRRFAIKPDDPSPSTRAPG